LIARHSRKTPPRAIRYTLQIPVKRLIRAVVIIAVLVVLTVAGLSFLIDANQFRPQLESQLTQALGRDVKVGDLRLAILSGGVSATDLSIADDPAFSRAPFLQTKSLTVGVDLIALVFSRKVNVTRITIDEPRIVLLETKAGIWNFSTLGAKTAPAATSVALIPVSDPSPVGSPMAANLSVKLLKISNGKVFIGYAGGHTKPREFDKVDLELRDFSTTAQFPFTFSTQVAGGGEIKLDGKAGPIDASDTALTPLDANLRITHFDLASSRLMGAAAGFGGLLSIEGQASSTGQLAKVSGRVKADHLKLARNASPAGHTVEFDFTLQHDLHSHTGTLSRGDIHIGKAVARLTGTYAITEDSATLNMKLTGDRMPVPELAAMLPAVGVKLPAGSSLQGGTAHASLSTEGPADRLVTTGSLGVDDTRLAGFDLGSKMRFVASVAGIHMSSDTEIQKLSASVRSTPEGTSIQDIDFLAPKIAALSGAGVISPSDALDFHMTAKLQSFGGMQLVTGRSVPFFIKGTASSPSFEPDMKGMATGDFKALGGLFGKRKTEPRR